MEVFLLALSTLALSQAYTLEEEWANFMATYNKYYDDILEEEKRMKIFSDNLAEIKEHNEKYKEGLVSFEMGMNQYGDMTQKEFEMVMLGVGNGLSEDVTYEINFPIEFYSTTTEMSGSSSTEDNKIHSTEQPAVHRSRRRFKRSLEPKDFINSINAKSFDKFVSFIWNLLGGSNKKEESVDWVKKGAVTPPRDQGMCGSCWAFSAAGALEGQIYRKTGKLVPLSIQNLVDCSRGKPYRNLGCEGGTMNAAFEYIKDYHIASEQSYPYEMKDSECRYNSSMIFGSCHGYSEVSGETAIMRALRKIGPMSVVIDATTIQFRFYKSGLYESEHCAYTSTLNHAVLAVGYGEMCGKGYWLVKNSWGTSWGDNGYVKIRRSMSCGIDEYAIYPVV